MRILKIFLFCFIKNIVNCKFDHIALQSALEHNNASALYELAVQFVSQDEDTFNRLQNSNRTVDKMCYEYTFQAQIEDFKANMLNATISGLKQQMAAIGWFHFSQITKRNSLLWLCSGSLISEEFILTSAHCTSFLGKQPDRIIIGQVNLTITSSGQNFQIFSISKIYNYSDFNGGTYNDIALIKFSPKTKITSTIQPACLYTGDDDIAAGKENKLIGMGYGTSYMNSLLSNQLYNGTFNLIQNEICNTLHMNDINDFPNGIIISQICAEEINNIINFCQADTGGPLIFKDGTFDQVIGVSTLSNACTAPGVYTRVKSYIDWIEKIVWP